MTIARVMVRLNGITEDMHARDVEDHEVTAAAAEHNEKTTTAPTSLHDMNRGQSSQFKTFKYLRYSNVSLDTFESQE